MTSDTGKSKPPKAKPVNLTLKVETGFSPAYLDRQLDSRHYEGQVHRGKWVHILGEAECGCVLEVDAQVTSGASFREAVNYFAAQYTFGHHTRRHTDICLGALRPEIVNGEVELKVVSRLPVGDLVRYTV